MKLTTISMIVLAFFLLRPYQVAQTGLIYAGFGGDDYNYSAHSTALTYFQFPDYSHEGTARNHFPLHSIGPALMALPFTLAFSLVDRWNGSSVVHERTDTNINLSWTTFGFVMASVFYLWATCWILIRGLSFYYPPKIAEYTTILSVLLTGVPIFAYRRPIFSHSYEIFLQAVMVFFLLRDLKRRESTPKTYTHPGVIGVVAGLILLVRYNNVPMALTWIFLFYWVMQKNKKAILHSISIIAVMVLIFRIIPRMGMPPDNYVAVNAKIMLRLFGPSFYLKRFLRLLVGIDWGLVYTAPAMVLGFVAVWNRSFQWRKQVLILSAPLLINLAIILNWGSQGGFYGYRYLVHSLAPLTAIALAHWWNKNQNFKTVSLMNRTAWIALGLLSVQSILSMISFEGNPTNLTQFLIEQDALLDWGNMTFQAEIWKTFFHAPKEFVLVILKAGPAYLVYLFAWISGHLERLPAALLDKYPSFDLTGFVRYWILMAFPAVLYGIMRSLESRKHSS